METFTSTELYNLWAKEHKITYQGKNYRVGKMSYGDYFFEPGPEGKETDPFNPGTLWLEKIDIDVDKYIAK